MKFDGFYWDEGNYGHCQKHGLTIPEIEAALNSGAMSIVPDPKHSDVVQRQIAAGTLPNALTFWLRSHCGRGTT